MTKKEKKNRELRLKRIKSVIYGEFELGAVPSRLPEWFKECVDHIAVQIDGRFRNKKRGTERTRS